MTTKLAGIIISTHNFAQMKSFYTNTLGLKISRQKKNQLTFKHENFKFIITTHSKVIGQAKDPHRIMINFLVKDIQSEYLRLKQKNVSFLRMPEKEHWNGWIATLTDPDGNIIQLLQMKET
tara:strand:- start:2074 stop:2436 length:363 start_codon:yes stop_codon:yes gene_type:complete